MALFCGGILAVLFRFSGRVAVFSSMFGSGSAARGTAIYLAACALFAVAGAGLLMSRVTIGTGYRWAIWVLCLLFAVLSVPMASLTLPVWLVPLWLIFRYAASDGS